MKSQQLQFFKIRDLRKKTQFKIDDEYLNGWAKYCGISATLVYISLCRHAEYHTQIAFPSQKKIAFEHKISVDSVQRGVKKLLDCNIISVEKKREGGKFLNYIYYLLDKSEWKKPTRPHKRGMVEPDRSSRIRLTRHGFDGTKDTNRKDTNKKDTKKKKKKASSVFKKKLKPYYEGLPMRNSQGKMWVIPDDGGPWLEFAGSEKDIEWK